MAPQTRQRCRGASAMPVCVLLVSLLPLTASGAPKPDPTHWSSTGQEVHFNLNQTTQEMKTQGQTFTLSMTTPTSSAPRTPSEAPIENPTTAQTAAYLKTSSFPKYNSTKETNSTTLSTTGFVISDATDATNSTGRSTSPSQSQGTTPTPPGTSSSTNATQTTSTLTKPAQNDSTTTFHITSSAAKPSTSLHKTTTSATTRLSTRTTKKKPTALGKKKEAKNGKIVAGVIGGALVVMMIGFLVIYVQKRKLQKQQISTNNWAGPTPFLESGANESQVTLRSSNRISISSFLPQRLSKRLSLLPEVMEEMEDLSAGSTFGEKPTTQTNGSKDLPKTDGTSVTSSQADNPSFLNEVEKDHHDQDESPQTPSGKVDDPRGEQTDDEKQP